MTAPWRTILADNMHDAAGYDGMVEHAKAAQVAAEIIAALVEEIADKANRIEDLRQVNGAEMGSRLRAMAANTEASQRIRARDRRIAELMEELDAVRAQTAQHCDNCCGLDTVDCINTPTPATQALPAEEWEEVDPATLSITNWLDGEEVEIVHRGVVDGADLNADPYLTFQGDGLPRYFRGGVIRRKVRPVSPLPDKPGAVGTATVFGAKGVRVMLTRTSSGHLYWTTTSGVEYEPADITDYVPLLDGQATS